MRSTAIVGLGNPKRYFYEKRHNADFSLLKEKQALGWFDEPDQTRHNAGFRVADAVAGNAPFYYDRKLPGDMAAIMVPKSSVVIVKPMTGMNTSGVAAKIASALYDVAIPDMLLVYDDKDLPLGQLRFQSGEPKLGSGGGHNGVKSVMSELGSNQFDRLKVGVGLVPKGESVLEFVLRAIPEELSTQYDSAIAAAAEAAKVWCAEGIAAARHQLVTNRRS